jgi:phosphomannomutase
MSRLMVSISGVRGIVGPDLNPLLVARWTAAFAAGLGDGPVVVGRDSRPSGERLACCAMDVLEASGREVWDLGIVPTPTVQVAVEAWHAAGGLILTASHNPAPWNALKFVSPDGSFLDPDAFGRLRDRVEAGDSAFVAADRWGHRSNRGSDALAEHRRRVCAGVDTDGIRKRGIRVLIDCVHGAGGVLIPDLLRDLGADVRVLHGEPHGGFPRDPEPTGPAIEALAREAASVGANFALAVDPDADRCALALPGGEAVGEEWTLPLVATFVLSHRAGPIVTNLSTSTRLDWIAESLGCPIFRTPVGEANVVAGMRSVGAVLGGEGNGGVIDPAVHYGRDAAVAAVRLLQAEAASPEGLSGMARRVPPRYLLKRKLPLPPGGSGAELLDSIRSLFGAADTRDGLRWGLPGGFVHVRASGTEPVVRVIVEAASEEEAHARLDRVMQAGPFAAGG